MPHTPDSAAIRQWASTVTGPVIVPDDVAFDAARVVWNRAIDLQPAAVVRCADVDDVRRTIEFGRSQELRVAVRSGGHSQAGHGTCDGGVVLDLGSFRGIAVDIERRVVAVAAGARVRDVLEATQAHGWLTPMGGCPDVGVGGLTLGGGENFLMARYGVVCDNLLAAELVLADGRLVRASNEEHSDLFWAIRGGSGNFGVATRFEYRLHPVGDVLSGQLEFDLDAAREVMLRYRDLMARVPDELSTSGGLSSVPHGPTFFLSVCYCGQRQDGDRLLDEWVARLQPRSHNVQWGPYASELSVPATPSVGTGRFLPALSDEVIDVLTAAVADAPREASAVWNDFHGAVTRVPLDAMAFPLRRGGFDLFITVPYASADAREEAIRWSSSLADGLQPFADGVYVNNLNETEADRVREAYGPHYDRLAAIKAKYDPQNVFRVNHNIEPE